MNSRDNLRQGVVDLLNLAASIQTFDIDGNPATQGDLAGVPVNFVGHSLGGISGTVFSALTNDATLNATVNGIYGPVRPAVQLQLPHSVFRDIAQRRRTGDPTDRELSELLRTGSGWPC